MIPKCLQASGIPSRDTSTLFISLIFLLLDLTPARRGTTVLSSQKCFCAFISLQHRKGHQQQHRDIIPLAAPIDIKQPSERGSCRPNLIYSWAWLLCVWGGKGGRYSSRPTQDHAGVIYKTNRAINKQTKQLVEINLRPLVRQQRDGRQIVQHPDTCRRCLTFVSLLVQHSTEAHVIVI